MMNSINSPQQRGLSVVAVAVLFSGCSICQSPYDYCSSVVGPNGCPDDCDFGARVGSAFAPPGGGAMHHGPTVAARPVRQARLSGPNDPPEPPAADGPPDSSGVSKALSDEAVRPDDAIDPFDGQ